MPAAMPHNAVHTTQISESMERCMPPSDPIDTVDSNNHIRSVDIPYESQGLAHTRTSSRTSRQPSHIRDYHCHMLKYNYTPPSQTLCPLTNHISYKSLSESFKHFVLNVSAQFEPQFFHQAVT